MNFSVSATSLTGLDSKRYSLQGPLIRSPGRPAGGWRASLPIKGQNFQLGGRSALDAYNSAVVVLRRNGIPVKPLDIWTALNLQWMARTPEKYHMVPVADLLSLTRANVEKAEEKDPRKRSYKPSDWGASAWNWLNLFLAREEFHFRDFLLQCNYVLDMLNPATNPEIGCAECWREWAKYVEGLKKKPGMVREEARQWLVHVHNEVSRRIGKPVLSYEVAAKKAFWI